MNASHYIRLAATIGLAVLTFGFASQQSFFVGTLSSAFFGVALFSTFLILLRTSFSPIEFVLSLGITAALWFLDVRLLGYRASWISLGSLLGMASLLLLACRIVWWQESRQRFALNTFVPAFLFVSSEWYATSFLDWTGKAHPKVLDLYLYAFDASLHVQIPFLMGRLFTHSDLFMLTSFFVYLGLPIAIGLTFAGCLVRDSKNALPAFVAMLITGPLGIIFYNLFPALGPAHLVGNNFPWSPLTYDQARRLYLEPVAINGYRNAMPSLHAAWMYLVCWYSRGLSVAEKAMASFFLVFTLSYTMGSGEHYFIDLIVAVPFTIFVIAMANFLIGRGSRSIALSLVAGLAMVLIWFIALRFGIEIFRLSPLVPWATCALTILACAFAGRKLLILDGHTEVASKATFVDSALTTSLTE